MMFVAMFAMLLSGRKSLLLCIQFLHGPRTYVSEKIMKTYYNLALTGNFGERGVIRLSIFD